MTRLGDRSLHLSEREYRTMKSVFSERKYHIRKMVNGDVQVRKIRSDKGKRRMKAVRPYYTGRVIIPSRPKNRLLKLLGSVFLMTIVANLIWESSFFNPMADPIANRTQIHGKVETMVLKPFEVTKAEAKAETVEDKIRNVFGEDAEWAIRCFRSESGLRPNAIGKNRNGTRDYGVSQLNSVHCGKVKGNCEQAFLNVDTNLKIAKQIFDASGSKPWYGKQCN